MAASTEPKTYKNYSLENNSNTTKSRTPTPDTHFEDLLEVYKNARSNYILRQFIIKPEIEQETQTQHPITSQPQKTQTN